MIEDEDPVSRFIDATDKLLAALDANDEAKRRNAWIRAGCEIVVTIGVVTLFGLLVATCMAG